MSETEFAIAERLWMENCKLEKQLASRDTMIEKLAMALKKMADANFNTDTSAHRALAELAEWEKNNVLNK